MGRLLITSVLLVACAKPIAERAKPTAKTAGENSRPASLLVLYSDAVEVRVRARVDRPGAVVRMPKLPPGQRYTLRKLRGDLAVRARVSGPLPRPAWRTLRGAVLSAKGGGKEATGAVTRISPKMIWVRTDAGVSSLPLPVSLTFGSPGVPDVVELRPEAGHTGEVEVSSWLARVPWHIGYTAVVEGDRASLQGWLSLTNSTGRPIDVADVAIAIASVEPSGASSPLRLGRRLQIAPGESVELPLFREPVRVAAKLVEVYDPITERLDHEGRRPVSRPSYGTSKGAEPAPVSIAIELDRSAIGRLAAGTVSVYRRERNRMVAIGSGVGFSEIAQSASPLELDQRAGDVSGRGRVVVGHSTHVTARRWQSDFAYDARRRRLIEEIRVELENRGERTSRVDVVEHLYRGLNWAIVYHNEPGPLSKTASQGVRFAVKIPPDSRRTVVYRVAYTW